MKIFKKDDNTKITDNFKLCEFQCKCGADHEQIIDETLVNKVQDLIETLKTKTKFGCKSAIISSGYRCPTHDKAVGGSGKGQHCEGKACDVVFKDNSGNPINSKIIACIALDMCFGGIARINDRGYIHLDVRSSNLYRGDEVTHKFSNIPNFKDYWTHYNIKKTDVYK